MSDEKDFSPPATFLLEADAYLKKDDFVPLDPGGGERHGSWECTWQYRTSDRKEWITLAVLPWRKEFLRLEVWVGADSAGLFGRAVVDKFEESSHKAFDAGSGIPQRIIRSLRDAVTKAHNLKVEQKHAFVIGKGGRRVPSR